MFVAGSVRGAISFGLVLTMVGDGKKQEVLQSTAMLLVFATTIVLGGIIPIVIRYFKPTKRMPLTDYHFDNEELPANLYYYDNTSVVQNEDSNEENFCFKTWTDIDGALMRKLLIYNWNAAEKEHIELSDKIGQVVENYRNEQHLRKVNDFERNKMLDYDRRPKLTETLPAKKASDSTVVISD